MNRQIETAANQTRAKAGFTLCLALSAAIGCAIFVVSILIADVVVPNHDWIADTISDLGAGRYEFIVDIGIYAFAAALICVALLGAHVHLGGTGWSLGVIGLALGGLIVFLIGARNEYGDNDSDGVVIHIYLVYALGVLFAAVPLLMRHGAKRVSVAHARALVGLAVLWIISAPIFLFLPTGIDGVYERYLGIIAMGIVLALAHLIHKGRFANVC
ncbi:MULTISPECIES: DUF998 domain-containing protein [unclassified Marinovum]